MTTLRIDEKTETYQKKKSGVRDNVTMGVLSQ